MKRNNCGISILFGMMMLFGLVVGNVNAQQPNSFLSKNITDVRYLSAENLVAGFNLILNEDGSMVREVNKKIALLVPVTDSSDQNVGLLSIYDEKWKISFMIEGKVKAFDLKIDENGQSLVNELSENSDGFKKMVFIQNQFQSSKLQKVSMTGSNYCIYTSKIGINFGCWSPDENPLGYYFVVTYREGSKITRLSQSYRADYKGRAVVCPKKDSKVIKLPQCGFPPD